VNEVLSFLGMLLSFVAGWAVALVIAGAADWGPTASAFAGLAGITVGGCLYLAALWRWWA
jgi:hypothetical protein